MANVNQMRKAYDAARRRIANMREKAEATLGEAVATTETVGAGFLMSYARGRFGDKGRWLLPGGVDVDLGAGLALHAVAFMGLFGKYDEHAHNIGNGLLTCYAVHKGFELGLEQAKTGRSIRSAGNVPQMNAAPPISSSIFDRAWAGQTV